MQFSNHYDKKRPMFEGFVVNLIACIVRLKSGGYIIMLFDVRERHNMDSIFRNIISTSCK